MFVNYFRDQLKLGHPFSSMAEQRESSPRIAEDGVNVDEVGQAMSRVYEGAERGCKELELMQARLAQMEEEKNQVSCFVLIIRLAV